MQLLAAAMTHVVDHVLGFLFARLRADAAERRSARTGDGRTEWQVRVGPYLTRMFETGRYPRLRDLVLDDDPPDSDVLFARQLDLVLDGLASRGRAVDSAGSRSSGR